jgi:putative DNA primase/helicase
MLTGGGTVTAEKKFGDQFQFENYAKLTFSCNKIPSVNDMDDEAYFSRWIIIRFEHKAEKLDKFLIDKITTEEEMSGLVNFALEGLERLLNNQDFSYQQTPEEIKLEMSLSGSSVAQFAHNQLEITADSNVFITKDDMYQSFINYVKLLSLPIVSKETLGKKLTKFIKISNAQKSIENKETGKMKQVACWLGVKFKNQNFLFSSNPNKEEVDELTDF